MKRKIHIEVPGGQKLQVSRGSPIRPVFEIGIPGYFLLTMDIPPQFFDMEMPAEDYTIVLCDERAPRIDLRRGAIQTPSVQQVLWAIGFSGTNLTRFIHEKPIRFLHQPFRSHKCVFRGREAWRQIIVSRKGLGFSVETVCAATKGPQDMFLGYLRASRNIS